MEIWKSIPGYYGYYECSDRGNVRSLDRTVITERGSRTYKGRLLNPSLSNGYLQTSLNKEGEHRNYGIQVLVAMTFLGHIPNGHKTEVDHINAIRLDNRLENLQLITHRQNTSKDQWRYNPSSKAVGVYCYKRTQKWISQIRINRTVINLGCYEDQDKAAKAYKIALKFIDQYKGDAKAFKTFIKSKL